MPNKPVSASFPKVERDPRLFTWLLTLIVGSFTIWSLFENPDLQTPLFSIIFIILAFVHVLFHWYLEKITGKPNLLTWYIIIQGGLAFSISWMSGQI